MAYVPGYEYDVFLSYAQNDNRQGYVDKLLECLRVTLTQRLGEEPTIFIDMESPANGVNSLTDIARAVPRSAIFLLLGSMSYVRRAWPQREMSVFLDLEHASDRVFVAELLPLWDDLAYPVLVADRIAVHFWQQHKLNKTVMNVRPGTGTYLSLVVDLATRILGQLSRLRHQADGPTPPDGAPPDGPGRPGGGSPGGPAGASKQTVVLGSVRPEMIEHRAQLLRYLGQFASEIDVRSAGDGPDVSSHTSFVQDLTEASLFIQLFGEPQGGTAAQDDDLEPILLATNGSPADPESDSDLSPPSDLSPVTPIAELLLQAQAAQRQGVKVMQWRPPSFKLASVKDDDYRDLLCSRTATVGGFEDFKAEVVNVARSVGIESPTLGAFQVFVDADGPDMDVAKSILNEFKAGAFTATLPVAGSNTEENRRNLETMLTNSDVLVFVYGETDPSWVRGHLKLFNKMRPRRKAAPRVMAVCTVPPADKLQFNSLVSELRELDCHAGYDPAPIRGLIQELGA